MLGVVANLTVEHNLHWHRMHPEMLLLEGVLIASVNVKVLITGTHGQGRLETRQYYLVPGMLSIREILRGIRTSRKTNIMKW